MVKTRILPGAAGIIALTAAIGFVDGIPDNEHDNISRGRITLISDLTPHVADGSLRVSQMAVDSGNPAYLVELRRGDILAVVLIDAVTGRILSS